MDWIVGSLIILGVFGALVIALTRRGGGGAPPPPAPAPVDDTIARRVRRLEDDLDDLSAQIAQLRDDVQYLMRQVEDR